MSLEESSDRILLLEKRNQELELRIEAQAKELDELRHANSTLHVKLDRRPHHGPSSPASSTSANSSGTQPTSLFNEIEMSSSSSIEDELRAPFAGDNHQDIDEDIECDEMPLFSYDGPDDQWKVIRRKLSLKIPFAKRDS